MNEHLEMKQLISAYFDGETTPAETQQAEAHLRECAQCREYFSQLKKISSSLKTWNDEALSFDSEQNVRKNLNVLKSREERKMKTRDLALSIGAGSIFLIVLAVAVQQIYVKNPNQQVAMVRSAAKVLGSVSGNTPMPQVIAEKTDQLALQNTGTEAAGQYEPYYLKSNYPVQPTAVLEVAQYQDRTAGEVQSSSYSVPEDARMKAESMHDMAAPTADPQEFEYWRGGVRHEYIPPNTEEYGRISENQFLNAQQDPLSTFSIDVDTASYANVRRFLTQGQLPPADAVRIEEMINYFSYDYPQPNWGDAFSITLESAPCPWNPQNNLVLIGLQGKNLEGRNLPASNLVFLIDVSGSMAQPNKLPLVKEAFKMMANQLRPQDRISVVVYAGSAGLVLDSASGADKWNVLSALDRLQAGGPTAGGQGIELAYSIAQKNFIRGGNNRVILATDGDFNVGVSNDDELVRLIEGKRNNGIFLSVLGFGMGNYKDGKMEKIADKGNGTYAYIDTLQEAQKVMVNELGSMLYTIAKDVKIQVEFNPAQVKAYRLVGYESRLMAKEDFNDDTKDAGDLGAGHTVTALYEIVPANAFWNPTPVGSVDPLKYQATKVKGSSDLMTVKLRYKEPDGFRSRLVSRVLNQNRIGWQFVSSNFQLASAVAEFGQLLRNSPYKGNASYQSVIQRAQGAIGQDPYGYRSEFISLVQKASYLSPVYTYPPVYPPVPMPAPENNQIQFKGNR